MPGLVVGASGLRHGSGDESAGSRGGDAAGAARRRLGSGRPFSPAGPSRFHWNIRAGRVGYDRIPPGAQYALILSVHLRYANLQAGASSSRFVWRFRFIFRDENSPFKNQLPFVAVAGMGVGAAWAGATARPCVGSDHDGAVGVVFGGYTGPAICGMGSGGGRAGRGAQRQAWCQRPTVAGRLCVGMESGGVVRFCGASAALGGGRGERGGTGPDICAARRGGGRCPSGGRGERGFENVGRNLPSRRSRAVGGTSDGDGRGAAGWIHPRNGSAAHGTRAGNPVVPPPGAGFVRLGGRAGSLPGNLPWPSSHLNVSIPNLTKPRLSVRRRRHCSGLRHHIGGCRIHR